MGRAHPAFFVIFLAILAPLGAVVVVSALLLFGVQPHLVFAPGWAVKSLLEVCGVRAPNAVGVACTVGLWWLLIVAIGLAWERRGRRHIP
ncbi:MAG TPA: hypothetical protein VLV78_18180 [Thermoanaerobaculia bacterium]|nr:hypothetical protein [Thermoanaerobaculia bacterium]